MGYVWCDGYVWDMCGVRYVWDMCGVRYANNLLKNPATKRLSGKNTSSKGPFSMAILLYRSVYRGHFWVPFIVGQLPEYVDF